MIGHPDIQSRSGSVRRKSWVWAVALAEAEARNPGLGRMHDAATDPEARVPMVLEGHPEMPAGHPTVDTTADGAEMP